MNIIEKINLSLVKSKILWSIVIFIVVMGGLFIYGYNQIKEKKALLATSATFSTTTNPYSYSDGSITFTVPMGWQQTSRSKGNYFEIESPDKTGAFMLLGQRIAMTSAEKNDLVGTMTNYFKSEIGSNFKYQQTEIFGKPSVYFQASLHGKDITSIYYVISNDSLYSFTLYSSSIVELIKLQPTFDSILKSISFK